nr:hypothetical protein [Mycobacterium sp. E3298]
MAIVKCYWCEAKSEKTEMIQEPNKKHYHKEKCHAAYLEDKRFKQQEREQQLELAIKIADVHGLSSYQLIPSSFYPILEDLRNDSQLFGKLKKNYKKGIPYPAIAYTYEYCRESIVTAIDKKKGEFKNKLLELRYGLAIVRNNLADAKEHAERVQRQKKVNELAKTETSSDVRDSVSLSTNKNAYIKKKDEMDISDLL